jgi:hypothetical protein
MLTFSAGGKFSSRAKPSFRKVNAGRLVVKEKRKNMVNLIKSVQMRNTETKYRSISETTGAMNQNQCLNVMDIWTKSAGIWPQQGSTDGSCDGDEIDCVGFMMLGRGRRSGKKTCNRSNKKNTARIRTQVRALRRCRSVRLTRGPSLVRPSSQMGAWKSRPRAKAPAGLGWPRALAAARRGPVPHASYEALP